MKIHYHYEYKDWIQKYSLWMGLLELTFLNFLGVLWIIRAYRLKKNEDYQPKLMYWLHVWYTFVSMVALILWLLPYQAKTRLFSVKYEFDEFSWFTNLVIILFVMALYSLPLLGIKRVSVPDK
jgi:hypothetical protein